MTSDRTYSRRRLLGVLGVAGVGGLAGCSSGQPTTSTPTPSPTPQSGRELSQPEFSSTPPPTETPTATPEPATPRSVPTDAYAGPLVSAHEHFTGPDGWDMTAAKLDWYVRWMDRNRIAQVTAFVDKRHFPFVRDRADRIVPFYFPWTLLHEEERDEMPASIRETLYRRRSFLRGVGEFPLYMFEADDGPMMPDHPELLASYDVAAEFDVPVMVHAPESRHLGYTGPPLEGPTAAALERAFEHNRDVTFVVHGSFNRRTAETVHTLLRRHPNFYYDISPVAPFAFANAPETNTRAWFEEQMAAKGVDGHAEDLLERYGRILREDSDRVLWGIDASRPWHFTEWALDTWVDVGRALLGKLSAENARDVAYRTAEAALGVSVADDWSP